jgi:hypothetical protein
VAGCSGDDLPDAWQGHPEEIAAFFADPLPGRGEPIGSPGAADQRADRLRRAVSRAI